MQMTGTSSLGSGRRARRFLDFAGFCVRTDSSLSTRFLFPFPIRELLRFFRFCIFGLSRISHGKIRGFLRWCYYTISVCQKLDLIMNKTEILPKTVGFFVQTTARRALFREKNGQTFMMTGRIMGLRLVLLYRKRVRSSLTRFLSSIRSTSCRRAFSTSFTASRATCRTSSIRSSDSRT